MATVKIHYRRLPDDIAVYENELVHADATVTITIVRATPRSRPMLVNGQKILENGSPVVWFTFPGADHDIGRFHTTNLEFTGIYANVLTPVEFVSATEWRTTDLFVDVWAGRDGLICILDEHELAEALGHGWLDARTAEAARATAARLVREHAAGTWPPPVVYDWPLERIFRMGL